MKGRTLPSAVLLGVLIYASMVGHGVAVGRLNLSSHDGRPSRGMDLPGGGLRRPPIHWDLIPFGSRRKQETAAYSHRHYGHWRWRLTHPKLIVLHFTGGNSYSAAWNTFAANSPNLGELPGVCAHFIVGKRGTIHKVVKLKIRCRHTIGVNYTAIGIEMVQPTGRGAHWADQRILHRHRQIHAALHLVKWLKRRFHIPRYRVIGHAMANKSRFFVDHEGWRNTHTDWLRRDVKIFRRRLAMFP